MGDGTYSYVINDTGFTHVKLVAELCLFILLYTGWSSCWDNTHMHEYTHKHAAVTVRAFEEWGRCREMLPLHFSHAKLSYHPVTDACLGVCCPNVGHFPRTHICRSSGCRYFCLTGGSTVWNGTSRIVFVADANLIASLSCSIIWPVGNNVLQRDVKPTTAAVEIPDVWLCSKCDVHSQSEVKGVLMNELQVGHACEYVWINLI